MEAIAKQYLDQLKGNVDRWRSGDIDFLAFTDEQQDTWSQVRGSGSTMEEAVLDAIRRVEAVTYEKWMRVGAPAVTRRRDATLPLYRCSRMNNETKIEMFLHDIKRSLGRWKDGGTNHALPPRNLLDDKLREIWTKARASNPDVEHGLYQAALAWLPYDERVVLLHTMHAVTATERFGLGQVRGWLYRLRAERQRSGDHVIHLAVLSPNATDVECVSSAALYQLAADLEMRSARLDATWAICPNASESTLTIALLQPDDAEQASALIAKVFLDRERKLRALACRDLR